MTILKRLFTSVIKACGRRKALQTSTSESTELRRCLTTIDLTFIGVGSTLGSGIYVLTGEVARNKTGPAVVVSFLIAALASILSGLCYAEFGARIPKAGSAYIYCYVTIGEFCAFVIGWNILLEYIIGGASIARALSAYVDSLAGGVMKNETLSVIGKLHVPGFSEYVDFVALGVVLAFTVILSFGVKNSARFNNFCVLVNIVTVALVTVVGLAYADLKNWKNFAPFGVQGIFAGASTCFYAFIGFDVIATTGEETREPAKSIPIAMISTITICFLAYFGVSAAITLMIPYYQLDPTSAVSTSFKQRHIHYMTYVIGVGATVGLLGCTMISMVPLPRIMYALSQDGMICKCFSKIYERTQVPVISTVVSGLSIGLLAAFLDLDALVEMLSIGTLLAYTIVDICVLVLRYRIDDEIENEDPVFAHEEDENSKLLRKLNTNTLQRHSTKINLVLIGILVQLIGICLIFSQFSRSLIKERNPICITVVVILGLLLLTSCLYLTLQPVHTDGLSFKVPLVPWIPVLALFFNIFLLMKLNKLTWYRFVVWMTIGLFVYFFYGMNHSVEKTSEVGNEENGDVSTRKTHDIVQEIESGLKN